MSVPVDLLPLERSLVRHYFRLQEVERRLSKRARRQRPGGGALLLVEEERRRLGRELHTGVGQMLAAIGLQLETINLQLPDPPVPVRQALDRISTLAREALDQVRSISRRLHPPEWQRLPLDAAIRQLWDLSGIPSRFDAALRVEEIRPEPDLEIKTLVYRTVQEALSNIARHARCRKVELILEVRAERVELTVRDDGAGFDAAAYFSAPPGINAGLGLRGIRELAGSVGGTLNVESGQNGTTLALSAPLKTE